ncbi:hypothetical protein GOC28_11965 [Sinorhizobium meliloti]|nr:hypothetical protein [Sinorhizobium meliloti]MDX0094162.1 hypothetical protein [Sinorhizobium meliloti]
MDLRRTSEYGGETSSRKQESDEGRHWSSRHVRLRAEMMITSVLIFTFSFFSEPLKPSILLPINYDNVPQGYILAGLYGFFGYSFAHFIVKTIAERPLIISKIAEEVHDVLDRIRSTRERLDQDLALMVPPSTFSLSEYVEDLKAELKNYPTQSIQHDEIMQSLQRLQSQIKSYTPDQIQMDGGVDNALRGVHDRITDYLRDMKMMTPVIANGIEKIERLDANTKNILQRLNTEFCTAVQVSNKGLNRECRSLGDIYRRIKKENRALSFDAIWLSCYIPGTLALALVLLSIIQWRWQPFSLAPELDYLPRMMRATMKGICG